MQTLLQSYGWQPGAVSITPLGNGLINTTWKVDTGNECYVLQKINTTVFRHPEAIAANIDALTAYLKQQQLPYFLTAPLLSAAGNTMVHIPHEGYYRAFPFVKNTHSKDVLETPGQAFEAARQFGLFTAVFSGMDMGKLQTTIPAFHDLSLRYAQFEAALVSGDQNRIAATREIINRLQQLSGIAERYQKIKADTAFRLRVTHHDTKISNVLFDEADKAVCVIDLDTVMPGYFISDLGDMLRTYLCPVSEEEKDFSTIAVRDEFYAAIVQGYYSQMKDQLSVTEAAHFFYAGQFMLYMQALRFFTDYLNNDIYYGAQYPQHNLVRAENQLVLLERYMEKKKHYTSVM